VATWHAWDVCEHGQVMLHDEHLVQHGISELVAQKEHLNPYLADTHDMQRLSA
jgi:hypothetical protein